MHLEEIEDYIGVSLPSEYNEAIRERSKYKIEYKEWVLFSDEELKKEINLSGNKLPYYKILEGHYRDSEGFNFKNRSKLKTAVAISSENSDILFFNKKLQIYIYFLSSQEVIKVANSFKELQKFLVKPEVFDVVENINVIGAWAPYSSTTDDMDIITLVFPKYKFFNDGAATEEYNDEIKKTSWKTVRNKKDLRSCILLNDAEKIFISELTEDTFLYSNEDNDLEIVYKKVDK